jgi:hypothetical protein
MPRHPSSPVKDKIKAWRDARRSKEQKASAGITSERIESLAKDLSRYADWNYEIARPADVGVLLELAAELTELAWACRVLAGGAEYQLNKNSRTWEAPTVTATRS